MKLPTLTIGIPAYNEEHTIGNLLKALHRQKHRTFVLKNIYVYSDASSDATNTVVTKLKKTYPKLSLIVGKSRQGQPHAQNVIISRTTTDILVLVNADVFIDDTDCIEKLIRPITAGSAQLTSCKVVPVSPTSRFEQILYTSNRFKETVYEAWNHGNNIYTCHGRMRAFGRNFYRKLTFQPTPAEDAFSFLQCQALGHSYTYVPETRILYTLPGNMKDHQKQSIRFIQSKQRLYEYFGKEVVDRSYALPSGLLLQAAFTYTLRHPADMIAYVAVFGFMLAKSRLKNYAQVRWDVSASSKRKISRA